MNSTRKICLAIETAIGGGTLAVFEGNRMASHRFGSESTSRAENLLPNIDEILDHNGIRKSGISRIAVSTGPGSYTGLRIGIATVLGLGRALGIETIGVSLFSAIDATVKDGQAYVVAVPMGRNDVCFEVNDPVAPMPGLRVSTLKDLLSTAASIGTHRILTHSDLYETINELSDGKVSVTDLGSNMAEYVGRAALLYTGKTSMAPIYVQNPRIA